MLMASKLSMILTFEMVSIHYSAVRYRHIDGSTISLSALVIDWALIDASLGLDGNLKKISILKSHLVAFPVMKLS